MGGLLPKAGHVRVCRNDDFSADTSDLLCVRVEKGSIGMGLENQLVGDNVLVTSLTKLVNWSRSNSVWPCTFGLACCALEMIASTLADFDISRFGSEVFRHSPGSPT